MNKAQNINVSTYDEKRIEELIEQADPYLKSYIQSLKDVSDGWKRLFYETKAKIKGC